MFLKLNKIDYFERIFAAYIFQCKTSNMSFWHLPVIVNYDPSTYPEYYYFDFREKLKYISHFDNGGIILLDYKAKLGLQYNPDAIAQYCLGCIQYYLSTQQEVYRDKLFKYADWFVTNLKNKGNIWVWEFAFEIEGPRTCKRLSRASAMSQGLAISALLRAYKIRGEEKYLNAAKNAFSAFLLEDKNGGLQNMDEKGDIWLEEYISSPPIHILNGFIWALLGLYDYYLFLGDNRAKNLFDRCIRTLENNLHLYDLRFWSKYSLFKGSLLPQIASFYYHKMHAGQLEILYNITQKEIFKKYAERWKNYSSNKMNVSLAMLAKAIFKLFYF